MRKVTVAGALLVIGTISIFASCDDQNIVEPRFYDRVGPDEIHVVPGEDVILVRFELPVTAHVRIKVIGGGGNLVKELLDGVRQAGSHSLPWDLTNQDGETVDDGVYGFYLTAGGYTQVAWFELDR